MGIMDKLKKALGLNPEQAASQVQPETMVDPFEAAIQDSIAEIKGSQVYFYNVKINALLVYQERVSKWPDKERVLFLIHCCRQQLGQPAFNSPRYITNHFRDAYVHQLLRTKLLMEDDDIAAIGTTFATHKKNVHTSILDWPVNLFINQIANQRKGQSISSQLRETLSSLKSQIDDAQYHGEKEMAKVKAKIDDLLASNDESSTGKKNVRPVFFLGKDAFSEMANAHVAALSPEEQPHWYALIAQMQTASGGKPSTKFLDTSKTLMTALGTEKYKRLVQEWMEFVVQHKETVTEHQNTYSGHVYTYVTHQFLDATTLDAIKGMVWMCAHFHDTLTLQTIARLAERSFKTIPSHGPACAGVGNACIFVLFKSKGLEGVSHLSRLKLRIKQSSTQKLIDKYLSEAAEKQGITVTEIEEMSVDAFGLVNGRRTWKYDDFALDLEVIGPGKTIQTWRKPDGSPQKSEPASVKAQHGDKLKKMKLVIKQIEQASIAQRDRIDRLFRSTRKMKWEYFQTQYLQHGLLTWFAQRLIWRFEWGQECKDGIWKHLAVEGETTGEWVDAKGQPFIPSTSCTVALWHPALSSVAEIKAWRDFLIAHERQQPLKQAFREVYLLTEAEARTRTYSNRMAAHILRQHQFNSLAKTRGWQYSLLGAYDDGRDNEVASLQLPEYGLRAEYWLNPVNDENAFNDAGIWNYVATDQVRFVNPTSREPIPLIEIPAIPFSEAMRDVDLFVGVASVGNDPQWQDSGGIARYRNYWQQYSFGDLSELAKTRKEILMGLVPRLKIKQVASISGNFLVVKGQLRTYKIHIGSGNILMEPNDQYLCIVPDNRAKTGTEQVFLPFEGDSVLSIILSKAFLLASDDKITDKTITSQIARV
jgi:hypothetical protein